MALQKKWKLLKRNVSYFMNFSLFASFFNQRIAAKI